jgi:prefoldin subunit 4
VGGTFYSVPLEEAKEMLETATGEADKEIEGLDEQMSTVRDEMNKLKAELYARFGRGINLEA